MYEQGLSLRHTIGAFVCFTGLYAFIETTSIYTMFVSHLPGASALPRPGSVLVLMYSTPKSTASSFHSCCTATALVF